MKGELQNITNTLVDFIRARDWEQFHNPKDDAIALSVEASELLEQFLWIDAKQSHTLLQDPDRRKEIESEVADILAYLLEFCHFAGVDPVAALETKLKESDKKYPVEKSKGSYTKYSRLKRQAS